MAYSLRDEWGNARPIRLIADRQTDRLGTFHMFQICDEVEPFDWTVDPCARQHQRIEIVWRANSAPQYHYWYEVILPDDTIQDIDCKLRAYAAVKTARLNYERARDAYTHVLGRSPELCRRCA